MAKTTPAASAAEPLPTLDPLLVATALEHVAQLIEDVMHQPSDDAWARAQALRSVIAQIRGEPAPEAPTAAAEPA